MNTRLNGEENGSYAACGIGRSFFDTDNTLNKLAGEEKKKQCDFFSLYLILLSGY